MLQTTGSQRVRHDLATEQQQQNWTMWIFPFVISSFTVSGSGCAHVCVCLHVHQLKDAHYMDVHTKQHLRTFFLIHTSHCLLGTSSTSHFSLKSSMLANCASLCLQYTNKCLHLLFSFPIFIPFLFSSGWLLSLNNMHLSFLHVSSWLDDSLLFSPEF